MERDLGALPRKKWWASVGDGHNRFCAEKGSHRGGFVAYGKLGKMRLAEVLVDQQKIGWIHREKVGSDDKVDIY